MRTVLVIPNWCAMIAVDGATIEEDTGLIKVKEDTTSAVIHFLRVGQLYVLR